MGRIDDLGLSAERLYFELLFLLESDKEIAKRLQKFYNASAYTIERNLKSFRFKNKNATQRFIDSSILLIDELKTKELESTVLVLQNQDKSALCLKQTAKKLLELGLHVLAPQFIVDQDEDESQFWRFVQEDIQMADFVVIDELTSHDKKLLRNKLKKFTNEEIEIYDAKDLHNIQKCALKNTIKKSELNAS